MVSACGSTSQAIVPSNNTATFAADSASNRLNLDCVRSGKGATGPEADKFCWIDWTGLPLKNGTTPVRISVDGGYFDADATLTIPNSKYVSMFIRDYTAQSRKFLFAPAYKLNGHKTALGFHVDEGHGGDNKASIKFSNIKAYSTVNQDGSITQLQDWDMAFGDAETMSDWGTNMYEQTIITSDKPLRMIGAVNAGGHCYQLGNIGWGTGKVTLKGGGGEYGHGGPQGTSFGRDSDVAVVAGATMPTTFTVEFDQYMSTAESAIAVGFHLPYTKLYQLTYDSNGASGNVPRQ